MPGHGSEDLAGIARIDGELGNLLAVAEAEMLPSLAGVSGFIYAVANGEVRPVQTFTAADINNVGIRRCDCQGADGAGGLIVKDRLPCATVIVSLPDSAVANAYIEDAGLAGNAGDGARASATIGADGTPVQRLEQPGINLGERCGLGCRL